VMLPTDLILSDAIKPLLRRIEVDGCWFEAGELVGILKVEEKVVHILTLNGPRVIPKEWVKL
jgi:hypothetical protein